MYVFIDESGTFVAVEGQNSVSLAAALVFSKGALARFERDYALLRRRLPKDRGEVKGRHLSESQIRKVTRLLRRSGALLEVIVTDSAYHTSVEIGHYQMMQAEAFTSHITDEHHPNIHAAAGDLRRRLEALAPQLYVQSIAMAELIYAVLYHADIYFAFREPPELGEYHWTVDAKGSDGLTDWEEWWSQIIMPITQSKTMRKPLARVKEGNFSYQDKLRTEPGDYLLRFAKKPENGEFFDLRPILSDDFRFSSDAEPGLEAVDILANAVRRALNGNLKQFGWGEIRRLMIHRRDHYLQLVSLAPQNREPSSLPYQQVIDAFRSGGRRIFPSSEEDQGERA